ncbi:MAG: cell division protein FtsZ [Raineya sp.]|nr:cell division protein FtsZ [Raineya sp.]MDW8296177.1 cell division protein FtsZ [Raineya sp.]
MSYTFVKQNPQGKSIIKVIGVGGGGSNAVNHMFNRGIKDVEFVVCNTDAQALNASPVPTKLQIGINLTEGLGAGANPEKGREAALESREDIRELLANHTKMVFVTAGMGGGTGTGAAPVIAQIARDLGILTVGIVTAPFSFEGRKKIEQAKQGIEELRKYCDTLIIISNDKLKEIYGNLTISNAFAQADNILLTAAKSIAELITVHGYVNVDFEDVKTIMSNSGTAVMGSAKAEGEDRALKAVEEALNSPLLNNRDIRGAKKMLVSVMSSDKAELRLEEFTTVMDYITDKIGGEAENVIWGQGIDPTLGDAIRVTVIATGFTGEADIIQEKKTTETKIVHDLETGSKKVQELNLIPEKPIEIVNTATPKIETEIVEKEKEKEKEVVFEMKPVVESVEDTIVEIQPEKIVYDLEKKVQEIPQDLKKLEEERAKQELKRKEEEALKKRMEVLKSLSNTYESSSEEIKYKSDVPAFKRKGVQLEDTNYSNKEVSRYSLDGDNQITTSNKFFTDKPD